MATKPSNSNKPIPPRTRGPVKTFAQMSHPEREEREAGERQVTSEMERDLCETARLIEGFRDARPKRPSDRAWVKEWPGLGSAKTLHKILTHDFTGLNVAKKLTDYRGVLTALTAQSKADAVEDLYDDLGGAQEVALAVLRLMHHHGKDRVILIEGGSGGGKTSALDVLERTEGSGSMIRLEADETWRSPRVAMARILKGLGMPSAKIPGSTGERLDNLLQWLERRGRVLLVIDEAHHISGMVLNLLKTMINRTEALVILAGMATLIQKLRTSASEEAKQLFQNRLFCRVRLAGPDEDGTRIFLQRRLGVPGTAWKRGTMQRLAADARDAGLWSFLRRVVDQVKAEGSGEPTDAELLAAGKTAVEEIA